MLWVSMICGASDEYILNLARVTGVRAIDFCGGNKQSQSNCQNGNRELNRVAIISLHGCRRCGYGCIIYTGLKVTSYFYFNF